MTLHNANRPAIDILAATVAATAASWAHVGGGDKLEVDRAAVDAMRTSLMGADFGGIVVIGEGERDEAPMLYIGEKVGAEFPDGQPVPEIDIAVDPLEGTNLCATGSPGDKDPLSTSDGSG